MNKFGTELVAQGVSLVRPVHRNCSHMAVVIHLVDDDLIVQWLVVPVVAAIPNGLFTEYAHEFFAPAEQLFVDPIRPVNGETVPSSKPGFGIEINQEAFERLKAAPMPDLGTFSTRKGWRWPPYL